MKEDWSDRWGHFSQSWEFSFERTSPYCSALMGMGSFASVASIIKLVLVMKWSRQPEGDDLWAMAENMNTWSVTEQFFAVMAACLPFLKVSSRIAVCGC